MGFLSQLFGHETYVFKTPDGKPVKTQEGNGQNYGEEPQAREKPGRGYGEESRDRERPGRGYREESRDRERPGKGYREESRDRERPGRGYGEEPQTRERPGRGYGEEPQTRERPGRGYEDRSRSRERPGRGYGEAAQTRENPEISYKGLTEDELFEKYLDLLGEYRSFQSLPDKRSHLPELIALSDAGCPFAQADYAYLLYKGDMVAYDPQKADNIVREGVEKGNRQCMNIACRAFTNPDLTTESMPPEARRNRFFEGIDVLLEGLYKGYEEFFRHALDLQYESSSKIRSIVDMNVKDKLAELERDGSGDAYGIRGMFYFYGIYYPQDLDEARECFLKAKELNGCNAYMLSNPAFA